MIEMLVRAIEAAGSTDAVAVARALEGMRYGPDEGSPLGTVLMRAADHQLMAPLVVSVMARQGSPDVRFDVEGSGFGFRTDLRVAPERTERPTRCRMPGAQRTPGAASRSRTGGSRSGRALGSAIIAGSTARPSFRVRLFSFTDERSAETSASERETMSVADINKAEIVAKYQRAQADTGSPEVQIALADRSHQRADRSLQGARQGSSLAPRSAENGQPAPQVARLPEGQEPRNVQGVDR